MHKIKLRGKFFKSLNFRIMVIIFLAGTIPAVLLSFLALASYTEQSMIRLGNDVSNQCQILAAQISSANYLDNPNNETLAAN